MAVDDRTGLAEVTSDIQRGSMVLHDVSTLLLLVGRADVSHQVDTMRVLDGLTDALYGARYRGKVVVTGALPAATDDREMCAKFKQQWRLMESHLRNNCLVHFSDAASIMCDSGGVIQQLISPTGLTLDGIRELRDGLSRV